MEPIDGVLKNRKNGYAIKISSDESAHCKFPTSKQAGPA